MVLIAHNEMGHDAVEGVGYDGTPARVCPLYPGMTCREHVDAAVDIESRRDEDLVPVPFLELCPNSWLVPPTGAVQRIEEADQFSPAKIRAQVERLQETLGTPVPRAVVPQVANALAQADAAAAEDDWGKALQALAGLARLVPKPHAALTALVAARLADLQESVAWALEDLQEGKAPLPERVAALRALRARIDVPVYGRRVPAVAALDAWLAAHAR